MNIYKIIADSSCDLRPGDLEWGRHEFVTIPLSIRIGETNYNDDVTLDTQRLIAELKSNSSAFKTAAPAPDAFLEEMHPADNVICMTLSSKLSGTYNSARIAADTALLEQPGKNIFVLDSLLTSSAMALLLCKLRDLLESEPQLCFCEVTERLTAWRNETKIRFLLQDLGNLVKMGRMRKMTAIIASVLPIKLICGDDGNGEIKLYAKALGQKRALSVLAQLPAEKVKLEGIKIPVVITHCHNEDAALYVKNILVEKLGLINIKIFSMRGPASVYASDKGISIAF